MTRRAHLRLLATVVACLAIAAGCADPTAAPTAPLPTDVPLPTAAPMSYLQKATVQVLAQFERPAGPETAWFGSGSVISPDGLVLTNAHVARPQLPELAAMQRDLSMLHMPEPDALVVAVVEAEDRPPVPKYRAEVAAADGILDLAVLRIVSDLDGNPVDPGDLPMPHASIGDSGAIHLGDNLHVLGFPGLGGETITLTRGSVSGFSAQSLVGERAWIKTDSAISSGASGGLASDDMGRLIGIPTLAASVPGGINLVRPVALARPLIDAATSGREYRSPHAVGGSGSEALELVSWAETVDEDGCAVEPITGYPDGAIGLAAVFAYEGMTDGQLVYADWTYKDRSLNSDVWFWDDGEQGGCLPLTFHDYGRSLDAGRYGVEVRVAPEMRAIGSAHVEVGSLELEPAEATVVAEGAVRVGGIITDAVSGRPLPEVVVLVLKPGVGSGGWGSDPDGALDAVYTVAESGTDGRYDLLRPLERGVKYEVIADHPQYIRKAGVFEFDSAVPDVHRVDIELSR